MANKTSQAQAGSQKRVQPKSASVDLDFEDMLAAAIASVMIKKSKKRKFASRRRP
jgi:hypothetical protein